MRTNVQALGNKLVVIFLALAPLVPALAQDSIPPAGAARIEKLRGSARNDSPEQAHAQWRENMLHKDTPGEGCFQASFPAVRWEPAQCRAVTGHTHPLPRATGLTGPQTVGNGNDYALVAPGANLITQTVGSFPSVRGVTSEQSVGVASFGGGGVLGSNEYTLQINTNSNSTTSACSGGASGCTVWQQYLYAPDQLTSGMGGVFIQYWLLGYGTSCPGGYASSVPAGSCYKNSSAMEAPDTPITGLGNLQLTGTAAPGGNDTVKFFNGMTAYSVTASDSVLNIATVWTQSEFNVVGDAGGSEAVFNTGSVITLNVAAQYGSTTAPTCAAGAGTTGETNNLNLLPCSATGGATPSVQFIESLLTDPTISKAFSPTSIPAGGTSTVTLTLTNPNPGISLTGASFTDPLTNMSAVGGAVGGSCVGTTPGTLGAGATALSFSGITIPEGASCTVTFSVTSAIAGVLTNTASGVSSNEALTGSSSNSATLTVIAPPAISKTFLPNKFIPGGTTTVSFFVTNPNNFAALAGVAFTDALPPGLVVASPSGLSSTCGGTATASPGSGTISLGAGSILSSGNCTVTASVTAPEGMYNNLVQVTSTNGGTGNTSTATVYVATPPNLSKVFGELSIGPLASTTLSFTLMNPNHIVTLDGLTFSDTLPAGLVISTPDGLIGSCGGGTIAAPPGNNPITLTGATLAPQASCTFSVNVTSNSTVLGYLINNTSTVTSTEALPGAAASATIFIGTPLQISYAANLSAGESPIYITNSGASAGANICASVYAFAPNARMVSCCSCQVAPDALVTLGVDKDLGVYFAQTSVVIKLVATTSVGTCASSAGTQGHLANGAVTHATTLQPAGSTNTYDAVSQTFVPSTLSAAEYTQLTNVCAANFRGGGLCGSCNPALP